MKALVIGSGLMGSALAHDLIHSPGVEHVTLADINEARAREVAASLGPRVSAIKLDTGFYDDVIAAMQNVDVAVGATSYNHNFLLTKAAIESGICFCDLGGNMDVVYKQMTLDAEAKKAGVLILPNCGLAPGMACVIAAGAARRFSRVDEIHIRVGGLPQHPRPPLNYQLVFSPEGLINEYIEPAEIIRDGSVQQVDSMTDVESLTFPPPYNTLEAFNTSGGVSTLIHMFQGNIRDLDYKTIRYQGHCERFKLLLDLGFASSEPVITGPNVLTTREFFEQLLRQKLPFSGPDVVLMRVEIRGVMDGAKTLAYEMIDCYDTSAQMTAMMRTTAFPTSIIAQMAAGGVIPERGVLPPEQCVPLAPFLAELQKRNIVISETLHSDV